jgi:predicted nucleotidyltransferase
MLRVSIDMTSALVAIRSVALAHAQLRLLVLHGSRARGDAREDSDWDFAYLAAPGFDPSSLYADLAPALGTDRIDLADLATAGGLIRYRVARDGIVSFEAPAGIFDKFWFDAVSFWCDAAPVLRAGYESVLDGLGP